MADEEVPQPAQADRPPAALIQAKGGFSLVWLIPLIAVLIGAWLAYRAFSQQGPTVTITFETGEGLVAGKTKVKYRDIDIGTVEEVKLAEDLTHVVVTAELTKGSWR